MFFDFLITYWKDILYVFVAIVTILVTLLKKRGKVEPVLSRIYEVIPQAVRTAEAIYGAGNGEAKKKMVMDYLSRAYQKLTGYQLKEKSYVYDGIAQFVEDVLATPERKDIYEK